ncbi:MAG: Periplasmic binding protein [Frankiaceae bacterium]|nr:Periplasmic binding protein [Frankiaceae bacterium]
MPLTDHRSGVMRTLRVVTAATVVALVAACGSTVPPAQLGAPASVRPSGELAGPPTAAPAPGATAGTGSTGVVTGPGGIVTGPGATSTVGPTTGPVSPGALGSSRVTGPISLGVLYLVNDAAAPAGIDNGNTITASRVMHAYVDSWNHSGGIGGRRIDPVYFGVHSYNNNYEGQIAAACSAFTEDHHVAAVLMQLQYYSEQLLGCLRQANVPLISGDFTAPDRQDARRFPLFVTPLSQVGEDRESAVVRHLVDDRFLSARNRVGVIVEDCGVDNRIYSNGLVPALRQAHVPLGSTFRTQCFQSVQDFGAQTSQMSGAVLQFRQDRVDRVMVVSAGAEANIVFAFSEVAENQRYRPGYGLSSVAIPVALQLNVAPAQMQNMRGVGWLPVLDTTVRSQSPATPTGNACLKRLRDQGVDAQTQTDRWTAYSGCEVFALYDRLLRATAGNADPAAVLGAVPAVMRSYVAAATIDGHVGVRNGRPTPSVGRIFAYDSAHGFHYVSGSFGL